MTPHETALVTVLLERLKKIDSAPNDREAETLIRESTADQPHATYHLVQTVLMQDLSLHVAQNRIAELEKGLEAKTTSFLPPGLLSFLPAGLLLDEAKPLDRPGPQVLCPQVLSTGSLER
jgi:hypothetical protein